MMNVVYIYHKQKTKDKRQKTKDKGGDMPTFGEYVASLRKDKGLTLREFCRTASMDASNWSKVERGLSLPPKGTEVLQTIASTLQLKLNSEEYMEMKELAAIGGISSELLDNKTITEKLPLFFRTLRGQKPNEDDLQKLLEAIKKA